MVNGAVAATAGLHGLSRTISRALSHRQRQGKNQQSARLRVVMP
jgi:hypothetical protein